jgi:hypothetical protein
MDGVVTSPARSTAKGAVAPLAAVRDVCEAVGRRGSGSEAVGVYDDSDLEHPYFVGGIVSLIFGIWQRCSGGIPRSGFPETDDGATFWCGSPSWGIVLEHVMP